jgi:hypothetical protein
VTRRNAQIEAQKLRDKQMRNMRAALLATLKPYRQGEPAKALAQLQQISAEEGHEWGSYHWLKGVYLLATSRYGDKPDEKLVQQARAAMDQVRRILPQFSPDSDLYPAYIIDFYNTAN